MKKHIYLYNDEGVGDFSLFSTQKYFQNENITLISASQIIEKGIPDTIDLFIMPGGADRPYAKNLNGLGNRKIRQYVENGGAYLGICAGAYYGCSRIEFQKNTPHEICEDRELNFFKGNAIGCIQEIAPIYDETLKSATVTSIKHKQNFSNVIYWGGCYFASQESDTFSIIASYDKMNETKPAIISCPTGKGKAILSGVHFEVSDQALNKYSFDKEDKLKYDLANQLLDKNFNIEDYL